MSLYLRGKDKTYHYDFWLSGHRFCGRTGTADRREAKKVEDEARKAARREIDARAAGSSPKALTLGGAAARYWTEVGQHHSQKATTLTDIERITAYFGDDTLMSDITDDSVAKLVAWRRAQTVKGRATITDPADRTKTIPAPRISPATVNRSTIEPLQKLFTRARKVWRIPLPDEPRWKEHFLKEPDERVREVRTHEDAILWSSIRADYHPVIHFALEAGLRQSNCLLRKDQVDLGTGTIQVVGKVGKIITKRITSAMRAILMAEMANPTDHVFTYQAQRRKGRRAAPDWQRGDLRPITVSGLKTAWRRAKTRKGTPLPVDLRFHDLRHDFATKLLRETRNLKLVQKALDHSKIETTMRYAHVLDEEVFEGMEAASARRRKPK